MISRMLFVIIGFLSYFGLAQAAVNGSVSDLGDTVHFELEGQEQWDYDVQRVDRNGKYFVEVSVPRLKDQTVSNLQKFRGSGIIKNIQVGPGADNKSVVTFELSSKGVESFDYLTDQPSRLIVDFYKGNEPQKSPKQNSNNTKTTETKINTEKVLNKSAAVQNNKDEGSEGDEESENAGLINTAQNMETQFGEIDPESALQNTIDKATKKEKKSDKIELRKPAAENLTIAKNGAMNIDESQSSKNEVNQEQTKAETEKRTGIFDGGDPNFERFTIKDYEIKEDAIIASRGKIYLDFPPLKVDSPHFQHLNANQPIYQVIPEDTNENKMARLLQTLFDKKRYAIYLKTLTWFKEKYPNSKYNEIIAYMTADVHYNLWLQKSSVPDYDLAMLKYREAMDKYPNSPLVERTSILMGFAALDRGDAFRTLQEFHNHLNNRPQSPNRDMAKMALADAYLKLNKYNESVQLYNTVERETQNEKNRVEAAYRRGDVYFQKKDYEAAIAEYKNAIKKYPQGQSDYPNAYFNQAEAYFGLKNYKQAIEAHKDFIIKYPAHDFAGYSMTRIGESMDILGVDKSKISGAYLETYFRYGEKPSAGVARIRILSDRMKNMKPKEAEEAEKEMFAIVKRTQLPKIDQFVTVEVADGYSARKEYRKSNALLTKYYQDNPTTADTKLLATRIERNINLEIKDLIEKNDFLGALKVHKEFADTWLKSSERIDTKFYLGNAFEQAGVFKEAEMFYKTALNKIYAIKGTKAEKERGIFEILPTENVLNLRLAASTFQSGKFNQSYDYIRNIKNPENLTDVEQIERVQLAAMLLDKKGDSESAIRYLTELIKTWKGIPELVSEPYLSLAEIENKLGKKDDALVSLYKILALQEDSKKVPELIHAKTLQLIAELELEKGRTESAIKAYEELLQTYEQSRPLTSDRYKLGQIYFKKGEAQKAADVWKDLKGKQNDFWYNLAQEHLKGAEWSGDYKKYIKRIPAMTSKKEGN